MMKLKNKYFKAVALTLAISFGGSGCSDLIEIDPIDQIDASLALTTREGINASITTVYSSLKSAALYGQEAKIAGDALADNAVATNRSGRYVGFANNQSGTHFGRWGSSYTNLNRINLVLEAIPGVEAPGINDAVKAAWEGELKFLRALLHFELASVYAYIPGAVVSAQDRGGIPLARQAVSTVDQSLAITTPREPIADVYAFIYQDLNDAIALLGDISANLSNGKANRQAAQALLSRVALYNKDFATVVSVSNDLIAARGSTLSTAESYFANFSSAENPEALFEVKYQTQGESLGVNTSLQTMTTGLTARQPEPERNRSDVYEPGLPIKPNAGFGDVVPTQELLNLLGLTVENNASPDILITRTGTDVRADFFEVGSSTRTAAVVECTKWLGKAGFVNLDHVPVFRIAEAYLNRAEAYAESGAQQDLNLALADLNTIRTNRGLEPVSGLSQSGLIDEILLQRRLEFAFEGHRFFDLKRRGQNLFKPNSGTTIDFADFRILAPIPQGDVDGSNGAIDQNFGY